MPLAFQNNPAEFSEPPTWLAWLSSIVVHGLLLALLIAVAAPAELRGSGKSLQRDVGIVLKSTTESETVFTDENSTDENQKPEESETAQTASANPNPTSPSQANHSPASASQPTKKSPPLAGFAANPTANEQLGNALDMVQATPGGGRRLGKTGRTRVKLFGVEGEGTRFAYVLDRSDSMTGAPLTAMKRQLTMSLDSLDSIHQFHLLFFNHKLRVWTGPTGSGRTAFAIEGNLRSAKDFINGMSADGGTYRWEALQTALALRPDVIFFLTDTDNRMPEPDVARAIARATRHGIAIQTIEFGIGPRTRSDNFLKRLARETRGGYDYVDTTRLGR